MVTSKYIANRIKTLDNESDMRKRENQNKLKEDIKHGRKRVDLEKNET